jgi:hypothetical protein
MKVVVIVAALVLSASPVFAADPTMPEMVKAFSSYINGPNSSAFCKLAYESTEKIGDANGHESALTSSPPEVGASVIARWKDPEKSRRSLLRAHDVDLYVSRYAAKRICPSRSVPRILT